MDITIPEADARFFVLPPVPAATSPALIDATVRYVECGYGGSPDETDAETDASTDKWADVANEIAEFEPASLTDVAVKLLYVTHYLEPEYPNGQLAIDLDRFDVDCGRKLLRCAADILTFETSRDDRTAWEAALQRFERTTVENEAAGKAVCLAERAHGDDTHVDAVRALFAAEQHHGDTTTAQCAAIRALIALPAPDVAAVLVKTQIAIDTGMICNPDLMASIATDIRRFSGYANQEA